MKHRILVCAACLLGAASLAQAKDAPGNSSYPFGDAGGSHYSSLTQINAKNVHKLKQAWRYDIKPDVALQNTPIVVDGVLYGVGAGKVIALDAATGAEKWVYAPTLPQKSRTGFSPRGESWWTDGKSSRLLVPASNFIYSLEIGRAHV